MNVGLALACCIASGSPLDLPPDLPPSWPMRAESLPLPAPEGDGRDLLTLAAGIVGSWAFSMPTYKLLYDHGPPLRVEGDTGYSPSANLGLLVGGALGAAVGVQLGHAFQGQERSLKAAVVGSALATVPFIFGVREPDLPYYGLTLGTLAQALGAWLGSG